MILPTLRTDRLLLRAFSPSDADELVRLAGAREIAATTLRIPHPYTKEDAVAFIAACAHRAEENLAAVFAIDLREEFRLVGAVGLELELPHRRAELGYWIGVPYWGNGYATEAARAVVQYGFDALNLNRIHATHFPHNPASARVLRKIGMRHEGQLRSHVLKWDQFYDLELYGMLRADWQLARS
jgi:RimJ/RimL family protein N-acetyltransferase